MLPIHQTTCHPVSQQEYPSLLCGTIAPLFTPERLDGRIHFDGLEAMTDALCRKSSVSAILVRAEAGAMWSYTQPEVRDAFRCVIQVARGRKHVIAGTAGDWTGAVDHVPRPAEYFRQAADLSQWALAEGASAVLQPVPSFLPGGYDFSPQDRIVRFFEDIARAINGPILIYNQEGLPNGYWLTPEALGRLSRLRQFVGVIYHTIDTTLLGDVVRACDRDFCVIAGNDSMALSAFMSGATSSAGGLATLLPELIDAAWKSLQEPNLPFAWRAQSDLLKVRELLSPYQISEVGCALIARQGVATAGRNRAARRAPLKSDVDRINREINFLRAAYM
ncbi:MAG: dihydrodipicolinate synthase family protein [Candidatus Sumerlaeia bacterium]|nr:dihydrodipicolinate synthase family protein [Candidatus Sumerlaeia bacterium]